MYRQLLGLAGGLLLLGSVQAQEDYYPNYLIYRVNLDAITGATAPLTGANLAKRGFGSSGYPNSGAWNWAERHRRTNGQPS